MELDNSTKNKGLSTKKIRKIRFRSGKDTYSASDLYRKEFRSVESNKSTRVCPLKRTGKVSHADSGILGGKGMVRKLRARGKTSSERINEVLLGRPQSRVIWGKGRTVRSKSMA